MDHKIILSADSTCDLGDELRRRYDVQYYPFHVILDGKTYGDGVDLVPDQIYQVFEEKHIRPKPPRSTLRSTRNISGSGRIRAMR